MTSVTNTQATTAAPLADYTDKRPERCPHCSGKSLSPKGIRRKKFETVRLWRCASCERVFTPSPVPLRNKTFPLRVILDALTTYNRGYTLQETIAHLKARFGHAVSPSTLSAWLTEHRGIATYTRLRSKARPLCKPPQTVRSLKLYHRQVYTFAYHQPKLALLRQDPQHGRFAPLADFLERVSRTCPHELFRDSARASQTDSHFLDLSKLIVTEKETFATRTAALVLPTVGDNYQRHETLQRFMIANDSVTVAVEIPIWLALEDIAAIEERHGIKLFAPGTPPTPITGHIDFLQVRNNAIHILDYKPDARTNRPIAQLTIYALALSHLTGLRLFHFKCAWFNQDAYCEFFPRTLLPSPKLSR